MIHEIRIIFGDTDQMGVVYYANYLRFLEASRAAYLRALGRSHADLDAWGIALPVVEAHCRSRSPSRYEDLLDIESLRPAPVTRRAYWLTPGIAYTRAQSTSKTAGCIEPP